MTRIAVFADIHANLPALEAVLEDIDGLDVDERICVGDLVGRGPDGSAVCKRIRDIGVPCVRGNHEDYLLSFRRHEVPEEWLTAPEWSCSRWMAAELDDEDEAFIDSFPFTRTSTVEPGMRLYHGSPRSYNDGLGPWTTEDRLRDHLDSIDESLLVCAHTHRSIQWRFDDGLIVNVGSVGLPFNGDWRAQYAVFENVDGTWEVEMRRVPYDREAALDAYEERGFLEAGGATSFLLRRELETARSFLVPYLKWAEKRGHAPVMEYVDEFLEIYDPEMSMSELMEMLEA